MNAIAACCHFSIFPGPFLYQRAKNPQVIVLFIYLLGKGSTQLLVWEMEAPYDGLLFWIILPYYSLCKYPKMAPAYTHHVQAYHRTT